MRTDVDGYYIDPYIGCLQIRAFIAVFPLRRMFYLHVLRYHLDGLCCVFHYDFDIVYTDYIVRFNISGLLFQDCYFRIIISGLF